MEVETLSKVLKIVSIIYIVLAAIGIVGGIIATIVGGATTAVAEDDATTIIGAAALAFGIVMILSNAWGIVCGIVGIKASKGGKKALIATVILAGIAIATSLYTIISTAISTGTFQIAFLSSIVLPVAIIVPAIMMLKDPSKV